jgi:hypothetical protein
MKSLILLAASICVCCGGGGGPASGSATFSGLVSGQTLTPHDATAAVLSFSGTGVPGRAALIAIASAPGLCSSLTGGKEPKSTSYLVLTAFQMQRDYSAAPPPAPGTYYVASAALENGVAVFASTNATCGLVAAPKPATTGTITFTSVGNRYSGSYDLTFAFGEHVTGTFDAPLCGGISALDPGSGTLTCQ